MDSSVGDGDIANFSDLQVEWAQWVVNGLGDTWLNSDVKATFVTHKPFAEYADYLEASGIDTRIFNEPIALDADTSKMYNIVGKTYVPTIVFGHKHYDYGMWYRDGVGLLMVPKCGYLGEYESEFVLAKNELDGDVCCGWGSIEYYQDGSVFFRKAEIYYPRLFRANGSKQTIG